MSSVEPGPEPEQKPVEKCRLFQDAVDSTAHQIDNLITILEAQVQALWKCRNGAALPDMATAGRNEYPQAEAAKAKALRVSTTQHNFRAAWERHKQQIGGTALKGTTNERPADSP